ncbi:MAG: alpha/beta fold hydrolase [Erythrobacter sp.]
MARFALKTLIFLATAYLAVLAILFIFQSRFLFPAPQDRLDPAPGFEAVELTTSDNLDLIAHYRPAVEGRPTIVWFHGNGGSMASSAFETRVLAAKGYGLLLASYRGYGGNPGEPSEDGFYADGRSAMAFIADQGVPNDRLIIAGNSIGSGTAVQMSSEFAPAALILVAPFTSLPDAASDALPIFPVQMLLRDRFDNAAALPALNLPILILHGTADRVVPFDHGRALSMRNDRAEFVRFDGAGHDLSFWREAQQAQADWLMSLGQ